MSWRDVELNWIRKQFSTVLRRQRPVLAQLFHAALTAGQLVDAALPRVVELNAVIPPDDTFDNGQWLEWRDMDTFASAQIEARDIYAEALVASVARLLEGLKRKFDLPQAASDLEINGVPVSELFRSARNNSAHRDAWNDSNLSDREKRSRDANMQTLSQAGIANPAASDACYEAIRLLDVAQYLAFEALIELIATEYYTKAGGRLEP